jgi:hypothetical protein
MNEQIRLLAAQAGMIVGEANGFDKTKLTPGELKFAQLIVEECARDFDNTYMAGGNTMGNYIRQKFGVEL